MNVTIGHTNNEDSNDYGTNKHIFHQTGGGNQIKDWVLLDNQSTLDQFLNKNF